MGMGLARTRSWRSALRAIAAVGIVWICVCAAATDEAHQWTIAAYLSGDGDLGNVARSYAERLTRGAQATGWTVAIQLDQVDELGECAAQRRVIKFRSGQWLDAQRAAPRTDGNVNMASANTLTDFLRWVMREAPAERYALIILGHGTSAGGRDADGSGGECGVAVDASSGGDTLTAQEIAEAVRDALGADPEEKLAAMFLDSCYSGSLETAYELRSVAETLCVSPDRVPSPGIPWDEALAEAEAAGVANGTELVEAALRVTGRSGGGSTGELRLTGVRLAGVSEISAALSELTGALLRGMPATGPSITLARSRAHKWGPQREMCDALGFCEALVRSSDDLDVRRAAQRTVAAIDDAVMSGDDVASSGLGVFFPGLLGEIDNNCIGAAGSFGRDSGWTELISKYRGRLQHLLDRAVGGEDLSERPSAG